MGKDKVLIIFAKMRGKKLGLLKEKARRMGRWGDKSMEKFFFSTRDGGIYYTEEEIM